MRERFIRGLFYDIQCPTYFGKLLKPDIPMSYKERIKEAIRILRTGKLCVVEKSSEKIGFARI